MLVVPEAAAPTNCCQCLPRLREPTGSGGLAGRLQEPAGAACYPLSPLTSSPPPAQLTLFCLTSEAHRKLRVHENDKQYSQSTARIKIFHFRIREQSVWQRQGWQRAEGEVEHLEEEDGGRKGWDKTWRRFDLRPPWAGSLAICDFNQMIKEDLLTTITTSLLIMQSWWLHKSAI